MSTPTTPAPGPATPGDLQTARDKHRRSAADETLGPSARRHHEHATCGYDWALQAIDTDPEAVHRHMGYAAAYAEQARHHAVSSRRWTLVLPSPFCEWLTRSGRLPDDCTGNEADDRLLLAHRAGITHRIGPEGGWTRTIPAHDALAMWRLTSLAQRFFHLCTPGTKHTSAGARAAKALAERLGDLARRQLGAAS
ncbi:hypothetical protein AB0K43_11440 [Kitasatospora sp. NPDC049258]|uniref:hypothetical protein n=1 Tax=Kitasatospora sp. NPDC049258 TaxID=3155394 RepID=UPI0034440F33